MKTCKLSEKPVFLSHSGARALFAELMLKPDDLLHAADTRGVIGIEASPHTTISPQRPRHSIESVMDRRPQRPPRPRRRLGVTHRHGPRPLSAGATVHSRRRQGGRP
jgi:hypothetical protein